MSFTSKLTALDATPREEGYPLAPRVFVSTALILSGVMPVTWIRGSADDNEITIDGTTGLITLYTDLPVSNFRVGDNVRLTGIAEAALSSLEGKSFPIVKLTAGTPNVITLGRTRYRGDSMTVGYGSFEGSGVVAALMLKYAYVEFFGFKDASGTANAGQTLVGPDAAVCIQPLGIGTNVGYASTPIDGKHWGLHHWQYKVAADGDGVLCVIWD